MITSNGDLRRKQSNHKTDESMKIGQSVGFFGQLFLLETLLYLKKTTVFFWPNKFFLLKFFFDLTNFFYKIFFFDQKNILVKNIFG